MVTSRTASRTSWKYAATLIVALILSLFASARPVGAVPAAGISGFASTTILLGESTSFSFNYENTGPDTGYGPFADVFVDTTGPDGAVILPNDGLGTPSVSAAGVPLTAVATITVSGATYVHPITGDVRSVPASFGIGDQIYVYQLPFGSFTPAQFTAMTIQIGTSNLADVGTPMPIAIQPGFRDDDPLFRTSDNPGQEQSPFYGALASATVTPELWRLTKTYLGPESETATGPNFPRQYRLDVDIATGQTITSLDISDLLPPSMQYVSVISTQINGSSVATTPVATPSTTTPGGTLTRRFASVTGTSGVQDASMTFEFYVPRDTSAAAAVVPQGTDSTTGTNTGSSAGVWNDPLDTRDGTDIPVTLAAPTNGPHTLEQQSVAIQKSVQAIDPGTGSAIPTGSPIQPGQTLLRYTLSFQVSDYFALEDVIVRDVLSDGQRLFIGSTAGVPDAFPTMSVTNAYLRGSPGSRTSTSGAFAGSSTIVYQQRFTAEASLPPGTSSDPSGFAPGGPASAVFSNLAAAPSTVGTTFLQFNVSDELIARLGANAGRLVGGEISNTGVGPANNPFGSQQFSGTVGEIVFYALVSEDFSDNFPSSDRSVDQGDILNNTVNDPTTGARDGILADQIDASTINNVAATVIGTASDDSGASVQIPYGVHSKTIARMNGVAVPAAGPTGIGASVQVGDRITYKLTYTLPINSYELLRVVDFPPLPVMPVGAAGQYNFEGSSPTYAAYSVAIAPDDTFFGMIGFIGTSVRAATTADIGAAYAAAGGSDGLGAFTGAPGTIDGVALANGDLVLVKNQTDARQNGIYVVLSPGSWERANEMDEMLEVGNTRLIPVTAGTVNGGYEFVQTNNEFIDFNQSPVLNGSPLFEPFISTDAATNQLIFHFGNYQDTPLRRSSAVSLLVTLPVGPDPFSTDLFLTNQLRVNEDSTNAGSSTVEDLRRFELVQPDVEIQKGVLGSNTTGFTLGGIAFTDPSAASSFSAGPIDSDAEMSAIGGSNIFDRSIASHNVDADDEIRYGILVRNTGRGDAFDVMVADTIPANYLRPATEAGFAAGVNLTVRRGDGTLLTTSQQVDGYVRVATTGALAGATYATAPSNGRFTNVPRTVDGIVLQLGDLVLVKNEPTATRNGVYTVTAIDATETLVTLTRASVADDDTELTAGFRVAVQGGTNADRRFSATGPITLNTTAFTWADDGTSDYFYSYDPTTGAFALILSDNYTAGNVGTAAEDSRTGGLSRGAVTTGYTSSPLAAVTSPITNGSNVVLVTYDVVLADTTTNNLLTPAPVTPNQTIVNTATVPNFSNDNGGRNYTSTTVFSTAITPSDTASVITRLPRQRKVLVGTEVTEVGNAALNQATIGELVTYTATITVPEGLTPGASIVDTLDLGLAFHQVTSVTSSASLTLGTTPGTGTAPANTVISNGGRTITWSFGAIENSNADNAVDETITITYQAVVLNTDGTAGSANNQAGSTRNNLLRFSWTGNSTTLAQIRAGQRTTDTGVAAGTATPVTLVEPTLTTDKQVRNVSNGGSFATTAGGDNGDTVEYQIVITNGAAASDTTAFDLVLSDPIPALVTTPSILSVNATGAIRINGAAATPAIADFVITAGTLNVAAGSNIDMPAGSSITIVVQGTFTGGGGLNVDNTALATWSSMDGTPSARNGSNAAGVERTGADSPPLATPSGTAVGTLNDYWSRDTATIESPPLIRKTIVATSETHTTQASVTAAQGAVGEVVRFRLYATIAEGTTNNIQLRDNLPTGMQFLNDGTARFVLISTGGNVITSNSITNITGLGTPTVGTGGVNGNEATLATLTSAQIDGTFNDNNIASSATNAGTGETYSPGTDIYFRFGNLVNADNDLDNEFVVVEFNAVVVNAVANQAGTAINNSFTLAVDTDGNGSTGFVSVVRDNGDGIRGAGDTAQTATDTNNDLTSGSDTSANSANATVTVVEPGLTIAKQASATTGSVITYRVTVTNSSAANITTAFDTVVVDALDGVNLTLVPGSVTAPTFTGGASGATDTTAGNTVTMAIATMPAGSTATFTYQANVLTIPTGLTTLLNTANLTTTDLPGGSGTGGSWTGTAATSSGTPGAAGSATGERTGADGVGGALNDYAATDSERLGSIGDRVWVDLDNDGVQDASEPGIVGAPVTIRWAGLNGTFGDGDDSVILVTTGANGIYTISGLPIDSPGAYRVTVDTTAAVFTTNSLTTQTFDADGLGTANQSTVSLTTAAPNPRTQDFGYRGPGSIGDTIFLDIDNDGQADSGEGIANVTVTLTGDFDGDGNSESVTTTTNTDGFYQFNGLRVTSAGASYTVTVSTATLPPGVSNTTDPDGGLDSTSTLALTIAAPSNQAQDFGYRGPGSIGDTIFLDVNNNGTPDAGEGIANVTVTLAGDFDNDGSNETVTAVTDTNGQYLFSGLVTDDGAGGSKTYSVTVVSGTLPAGVTQTVDPDGVLNNTANATLTTAAPTDLTRDFGYRGVGSIGDTIFLDVNNNGVPDAGEGIANVTVTLTGDFDGDGSNESATAVTDTNGQYLFSGLRTTAGGVTYNVAVSAGTLPIGVAQTVDPDATLDGQASATLTDAAATDLTRDFGYRATGSVGDTIFLDANNNGTPDTGEGIANVTVTLTGDFDNDGSNETVTAVTDTNGQYLFSGLVTDDGAGGSKSYTVDVVAASLPGGVAQTVDPDGVLNNQSVATLTDAAATDLTRDFGYRGPGSVGDTIFLDVNNNGVPDAGEGIAGVTVTLTGDLDGDGASETITTVTDGDGLYLFDGLRTTAGGVAYTVDVVAASLPAGVTQTVDPDATLNNQSVATLTDAAPTDLTRDFGYRSNGSIGDTIFLDIDNDGQPDSGEGIAGVTVTLTGDLDGDGNSESVTAVTDTDGQYLFSGLRTTAGGVAYTVAVSAGTLPVGVTQTVDPDATTDNQSSTTLTVAAPTDLTRDFGYRATGSIGDTIFLDVNNNGTPDAGEGIANVTVTLAGDFDNDGSNETVTAVTDTNGQYLFSGLVTDDGAGGSKTYSVTVVSGTLPAGVTQTVDPDGVLNNTANATLTTAAPTDLTRDFGYRGAGSIGDTIFLDVNNNGVPDAGEGIANVTVTLTGDFDGDGSNESATAVTDTNGQYLFSGLRTTAGGVTYNVAVSAGTLPIGVAQTVDPDATLDGQASATLTDAAATDLTRDFGYRATGSVGDTIFLDANNNGTPDTGEGIANVTVTLTGDFDNDGSNETVTAVTDTNGQYLFSGLVTDDGAGGSKSYTVDVVAASLPGGVAQTVDPDGVLNNQSVATLTDAAATDLTRDFGYRGPGSVGDTIFLDVNNNGVPDAGEGIAGVTVTLTGDLDGDGASETITTVTDGDGLYLFDGLRTTAGGVAYTVDVVAASLPAGVTQTVDPDATLNNQSVATLTDAAPTDLTRDFGYRGVGSIGDRVWIDTDSDGVQDAPALEPGLPGVQMTLTWAGQDDTFGTADDITSSAPTDASGTYLFGGLPPGSFRVDVAPASVPSNMTQTYDLDGLGSANRADATLTLGQNRTDVDFGYIGNASVGDRVWLDQSSDGVQDASEVGLAGAAVQLVWGGPDGDLATNADNVVFTTTTGANGLYLFPGLPVNGADDPYRVTITGLPSTGLSPTYDLDSGIVAPDQTASFLVASSGANQNRRDVDFGYDGASTLAGTVYRDDNNNGIQDAGEPGIPGVTLVLTGVDEFGNPVTDPLTGLPYVAITDLNGDYLFGTVIPGTYSITETQPAAYNDGIDTAGSLGGSAANDLISGIPVGSGQSGVEYNYGERGTQLSGTVYRDDDRDGALDAGEPGIGSVTIELRDGGGALVATTTTQPDGSYQFTNIPAGSYTIIETQPGGYASSTPDTLSVTVPLAGLTNQNFGEVLGSISGMVYIDANSSTTRQPAEVGIPNIPVTLSGNDLNGNPVSITVFTDAQGRYTITNLFPPDVIGYSLTEGSAAPYSDSASNVGTGLATPGTSSNPNLIGGIGLTPGQQGINYDFGEIQPIQSFISGSVYIDADRDGARDNTEAGITGVTVTLLDPGVDGVFGNADDPAPQVAITDPAGAYAFPGLTIGRTYQVVETQPAIYGDSPVGPTTVITVANLQPAGSTGNNYGEVLGSLAGTVYFDQSASGALEPGEPGIAGVTVTLTGTDADGNPVSRSTTTAADGSYLFSDLPAGDYLVVETQPASYTDGAETVGTVGGILAVNDQISAIPLGAGVDATGYNFGELGVIVSGTVFYDQSRNGVRDVGDTGIGGVTIRLIDQGGTVVATTTTDGTGFYQFDNVPPGDYTIAESQPAGYGDPLVGPFAPNSRAITVTNSSITDQNFGDTLSTLSGLVYVDSNTSGSFTAGEPGIGGVTVQLLSPGVDGSFGTGDDQIVQTTTTAGDGTYSFRDLPDGTYQIVETQPASYSDGAETVGDAGGVLVPTDTITAIVLPSGVDRVSYNFGELIATPPGTSFIAGTVYIDTNNNGVQDVGESGIPGVTVTLTDGVNPPVVLTTDATGGYLFTGLAVGVDYTVTETQPTAYATGLENGGNLIAVPNLALAGSTGNNFGEIPGTISGVVYYDADGSAALSAGDVRLAGVTVTLLDGSGAAVNDPTTGLPYVLTTLADGSYLFENLPAGSYRVIETQPSSYSQGTNTPGAGAVIGGVDRIDVALPAGGSSPDNNFGEVGPGITGTVWVDINRDGVIDAGEVDRVGGVTITLLDSGGVAVATTVTLPDGSYQFTNIPLGSYTIVETQPNIYGSTTSNSIAVTLPPGGLTDQNFGEVLSTLDGSVYVDVNGNGQRDVGEPGISGVTVDLIGTDVNGNPVTRTTTTDLTGGYSFGDLPAGSYRVVEPVQPAGYPDGLERIGSEGGNTATNDQIASIPLGAGVDATGYDFGEGGATLAGSVYIDLDNDGVRDVGEAGISGVTVLLNGTDAGGNPYSRVLTTDASGNYLFVGLPAGTFTVSEAQPAAWGDGIDTPGSGGGTAGNDLISAITIGPADDLTGYNFGEIGGSISGTVFIGYDPSGNPQPSDPRLPNITVVLVGGGADGIIGTADDTSASVLTDASGNYLFDDLPAGNYRVVIVRSTLPPGIAEIFDRDGGTDSRTLVNLSGGENETVVNFSYGSPTSVTLVSLTATREGSAIAVRWVTATEENSWGFQVYRSATGSRADAELITPALIPAQGGQLGGSYEVLDTSAQPGITYTYWLVETEQGGATHEYGPVQNTLPAAGGQYLVALPMVVGE